MTNAAPGRRYGMLAVVALVLGASLQGCASPPVAADHVVTAAQADDILQELRRIRALLERSAVAAAAPPAGAPVPENVTIDLPDGYALGSQRAPVTLVEFTDYQCPFCRKYHTTVFDELRKTFVDTGKVRYVSRDLPLPMHEHALQAANAARCAGEQGQFWAYRHTLIVNSQQLGEADMARYASELQLDVARFTGCLEEHRYGAAVDHDLAEAARVGISGTPTFVIGRTGLDGKLTGVKIVGAQALSVYESKIRELLGKD